MQLLFMGPPGSGKGTQSKYIMERFHIPQISTGDMLRSAIQAGTVLGINAKKIMDAGALVSDEVIMSLVKNRLAQPDCQHGFLLDGIPRTLAQAESLTHLGVHLDFVVEFLVPNELIVERMSGRRIHLASGRIYNVHSNPPKNAGLDDVTGDPLIHREDDRADIVLKRLQAHYDEAAPLRDYYKKMAHLGKLQYLEIKADRDINDIKKDLCELLLR